MQTIFDHALLALGSVLLLAAIILALRGAAPKDFSLFLVLGALLALIGGAAGITNANFNIANLFTAGVTMAEVKSELADAKTDLKQENVAPLRNDVQSLKDAVAKQEAFNRVVADQLSRLPGAATSPGTEPKPDISTIPADFQRNKQYSVLIFYKDSRNDDNKKLVDSFTQAGFLTTSTNSTLEEAQIGKQPDNSTFIIPTDRGKAVAEIIKKMVSDTLPSPRNGAVTLGNSYKLRRGDVQVYLY